MFFLVSFFYLLCALAFFSCFFFNDTATTEIYTLSLHDALPISEAVWKAIYHHYLPLAVESAALPDRKSTRLNSSHTVISYAVFCLKIKKNDIMSLIIPSRTVLLVTALA